MIISRISSSDKDFNGVPYKEFTFYCSDRGQNRLIRCTGKTPVVFFDQDGEVISEDRLDKVTLAVADEISFWFDNFNRVSQIDVFLKS